jgi:hypothetical protein
MKRFRVTLMCLALIAGVAGSSAVVRAQDQRPERGNRDKDDKKDKDKDRDGDDHDRDNHDNDRYRNNNSAAYQDGLRFGQQDGEHNKRNHQQHKRWKSDDDRRAYEAGYNRGYQDATSRNNGGYRNGYPNGGYGNGSYPNGGNRGYGNGSGNPGYNMGYQDGTNDGRADRQAGRPFKYGPGYNHPDRGYNNSLGDKNAYQQQYRQGYQQAYQQAYGRRG